MKFNTSWAKEFVNLPQTDTLCEQITMLGLEVDGIESVAASFSGVVVGEVVECAPHPNADKLQVTKVNVGGDRLLDIVCGAKNCRLGLKVACATDGAILPGDFKIKKTKLRGEPSEGMLCSFKELGVDIESEGIIELDPNAPVGTNIREYLDLDDSVIEISLTPNRADCLSIQGIAREIAIVNKAQLKQKNISKVTSSIDEKVAVINQAPKACPKYVSRIINGVNVKAESPLWLQEKLRRCGIRSIDPIVDVTNFVLLELGQPMHAFDKAKVELPLTVRFAQKGEELVLLDEQKVALDDDTLIIADSQKALAMAGIFGGLESGVSTETKDIILESAFFSPLAIAGRARKYGLHTDSSHRFERGVNFAQTELAMEYATALILEICGGQAGEIVCEIANEHLPTQNKVILTRQKLDKVLGHHIADEEVTDILTRLAFNPTFADNQWQITAPSWRFDIEIEEDLIEEVARIYGYNSIPNNSPLAHLSIREQKEENLDLMRVKTALVDRDYQEVITYSFVDPKKQQAITSQNAIVLPNPISSQMSAMRLSLMTGLLETIAFNQKRQQSRLRFFETGLTFTPCEQSEMGIKQEMKIAGAIVGAKDELHWGEKVQNVDFFDLKGDLEFVFALTKHKANLTFVAKEFDFLHPGQSAAVLVDGEEVGFIGTLHPNTIKAFDLNSTPIVFELQLSALSNRKVTQAVNISKYPANKRDLALVVNKSVNAGELIAQMYQSGGENLIDVKLFDIFEGGNLAEDQKSLAFSLTLQNTEKTLNDAEINEVIDNVLNAVKTTFNAHLRD